MSTDIPEEWKLPDELVEFLQSGKQLEYDASRCCAGEVVLKRLDELKRGEVVITSFDVMEFELRDPMSGKGYWVIDAISLVSQRKQRDDDDQTLLWFPEYQQFGQWDREHKKALRFNHITWSDIVREPIRFLEATWITEEKTALPVAPWTDGVGISRKGDPPIW